MEGGGLAREGSVRRITLLTDFGTRDGFVGAVKGVLAAACPSVLLEDIAHDLPPGDVRKASWALSRYWDRYPEGTVHVVVVDPGVGTARRALAAEVCDRFLVAPDNGVLSRVLGSARSWRCVALRPSQRGGGPASRTFHGRDLFAPAAGLLAGGLPLEALGEPVDDPWLLPEPLAREQNGWIVGEVVEVDRFGNLATNLPPDRVQASGELEVGGRKAHSRGTYGEARPGELLCLLDSEGRVEVAVRNGSAAERTGCGVGDPVRARLPIA
jgi:hypothetical protein